MIKINITYLEFIYLSIYTLALIWGLWFSMKILYGATMEALKGIKELNSETRKVWNKDKGN